MLFIKLKSKNMNKVIAEILTNKEARKSASLVALVAVLMDAGSPWISKA
jgi:hypothetical protein